MWDIDAANSVRGYDASVVLIGGAVFNLGLLDLDALTLISKNHAWTSHDDVFDPFA